MIPQGLFGLLDCVWFLKSGVSLLIAWVEEWHVKLLLG